MSRRLVFKAGWILVLAAIAGVVLAAPGWVESRFQGVVSHEPDRIDADAARLHDSLVIADWHSDSLLWSRDLQKRAERGHVDLPRLQEGNVAIQMFTAVTKMPRGLNYESSVRLRRGRYPDQVGAAPTWSGLGDPLSGAIR